MDKNEIFKRMAKAKRMPLPLKKLTQTSFDCKEKIEGRMQAAIKSLEKTLFPGLITVGKYSNGKHAGRYVVLDGWGRVLALLERGEVLVWALVVPISGEHEEKELHYYLNMNVSHLSEDELQTFIESLVKPENFGLTEIEDEIGEVAKMEEEEENKLRKRNNPKAIRRIVLKFDGGDYDDIIAKIKLLYAHYNVKSKSEVFQQSINDSYERNINSNKKAA